MKAALARHDEILREAIGRRGGHVVKTTRDGFHAVFTTVRDAIGAAAAAERVLTERAVGGDGCVEGADGSPHRNCGAARR